MREITLAILGLGTVGQGVLHVLQENAREIEEKAKAKFTIKWALVHDVQKSRPCLQSYPNLQLTANFADILQDSQVDIVIELIGGTHPAREYMLQAMEAKKSVVTANKDVVAQFGKDMFAAAQANDVDFMFEASVGGGIPIIMPLKYSLAANHITEMMGIVNGTTNYMLTRMAESGVSYDEALREAQAKGYAEADPTADVAGLDAARKAAILASIAFNTRIRLDDVSVEGIASLTPADIDYAKALGYVVKLLAIGRDLGERGVDVRVHPAFLPAEHPLAAVGGVFNAIYVRGNAVGEAMFYGQGAGSLPTASAVVSDILEVSRDIALGTFGRMHCTCFENKPLCPLAETESSYYVRLLVDDRPGVLGAIASAFGDKGVSLKSVIQTRRTGESAEIVAITHVVRHHRIAAAKEALQALAVVREVRSMIRVEPMREGSEL